jgi:probable phosphoglycerate mutase
VSRRLQVEADGGSRGNPGPAGYGALVRDARTGEVLAEECDSLGRTTNNVAEYSGLVAGLRAAARLAPGADVEVRMDSKLVVEQMSGRWQIKHPALRPLAAEARRAAAGLGRVTYTWVPRARNTHADRLANQAMDAAAEGSGKGSKSKSGAAKAPAGGGASQRSTGEDPGAGADALGKAGGAAVVGVAPPSKPATVLLLRHGETPWSNDRRFAGSTDIPLTDTGTRQANAAAQRLAARAEGTLAAGATGRWASHSAVPGEITAIVASPLRRTRQTAAAVGAATGLPVSADAGWAEVDFGEWEGLTRAETAERWPDELAGWEADTAVAPPGGESFDAATRRVLGALDALLTSYAGQCVLVVSHVTPIKIVLLHALLAPADALRRMYLGVASLSETDWYPDGTGVVRSVNDIAHLQPSHWQDSLTRSAAP